MSRAVSRLRSSLAFLAGAALVAPLTLVGADPAAAAEFSVTSLEFTVPAGDRSCTLDADLYRPAGVDARHPAPAVLATNGFGGSKSDGTTDALGRAFASRGYVSLVYSGLGFGKSGCLITLDDPAVDGKAASGLIDFLAGTRAADDGTEADYVVSDGPGDPRVGMIGGSYGGAVQLATASADRRVDALVPLVTWNDLAYALAPNATGARRGVSSDTPGVFKWQWTNGFYLIGEGQPLLVPSLDPSRFNHLTCPHFSTPACDTVRLLNSGRFPAGSTRQMLAYARSVSPVSYLADVEAPTLLVQGQADSLFNLNEATATYRALQARGTTTKMIWQAWGHSGGHAPGELDLATGNLDTSYVGQRILAWFDRYLHLDTGADTGPAFAYHRDWASGYGTADALPDASRTLYLSGDGALVDERSQVASGSRRYTNGPLPTSHSESSLAGLIGLSDPAPYDTKGTHLGWTSAPLTTPVDVVGAPKATLKVRSPATERVQDSGDAADKLVLFAKVYDVAPDGTQQLVNRLVAPVRVPDVTRPFTVELPGIVHRYETGHRLRFVIAGSDTAYFGNRGLRPVTVVSAPQDTGVLELPVAR
ncbi:CocE/NonD family hydrolase [Streptomyces sp. SID3915]|uniref:CocE/NonD family hydrolase n=1 Tax=Streptomyces sp. SID3915 TaxID=2690263 RepID=UPI00136A83A7|nr:CocE/NonD family hydrolase [Streptomyces sp. SID3915]MYX76421.1 CocE/NonD family hydrolase [Streptomyces sp. SID3915]